MNDELLDLPLGRGEDITGDSSSSLVEPTALEAKAAASREHAAGEPATDEPAAGEPAASEPTGDSRRSALAEPGLRLVPAGAVPPSATAPPGTLPFVPRNPPSGATEPLAEVLPFRRKDLKRRKTSLVGRLVRPALTALVIVGLPVLAAIWLWQAPQFAVSQVSFTEGSQHRRVPKAWVETALRDFLGRNIWELPLSEAESALKQHPWVSSVALHKEPPRTLRVQVVERQEVALYRGKQSELFYVDAAGLLIDRFDLAKGGSDLPIFSGGDPEVLLPSAVALLDELEAARPIWLNGLSEIEILGERDYRLFTADIPFPLLVRAGTLNDKTRRLQALLPQIVDRYPRVTAVDLRFARRIIVQPTDLGDSPTAAKAPAKNT